MSDNKLSRGQRLLIVFTGLRNITDLFLGAFLISFIMQRATNQIVSVSMYQLFHFTAVCFGFFAFAHWCKRYNKVSVFALNIVPKIILLASIVYLGDRVVDYVIPLGFIYGLGSAMYHLPRNLMVGEQVPSDLMPHFISSQNIVSYIVKIVAPITLGLFITAGSYTGMACVLLVVSCIALLLSFMLTPSRHRTRAPLDFSGFFRCMMRFSVIKRNLVRNNVGKNSILILDLPVKLLELVGLSPFHKRLYGHPIFAEILWSNRSLNHGKCRMIVVFDKAIHKFFIKLCGICDINIRQRTGSRRKNCRQTKHDKHCLNHYCEMCIFH